jgi:anaerobic ribonucleoside-triphosphate reductase activating protein
MRYHNITKADMLNGEGLRVVLWVSGCSHHCQACQNAITWNKDDGLVFDEEAKEEIFKELDNDWCSGLTLSGGDPLFIDNRESIAKLVKEVRKKYPKKSIWCYTGYTWNELLEQKETDKNLDTILNNIDVLLDGKFVLALASIKIHYVGSSNQCIIDVKESLKNNKKILYIDNSKFEGEESL